MNKSLFLFFFFFIFKIEMRQIPIEFRHFPMDPMRAMHPPMPQSSSYEQHQPLPMMPPHNEQPVRTIHMFHPEQQQQQLPQMVPPRPEPANNRFSGEQQQEQQSPPMMPPQKSAVRPMILPIPNSERSSPFQGIPIEIRRIIQQVPMEIKNIIQHITSDSRPLSPPEGARREVKNLSFIFFVNSRFEKKGKERRRKKIFFKL